jgi:hypothetical protein
MNRQQHTPTPIKWLGYGGLIPFLVLTIAQQLSPHHQAVLSYALVGYGATILSFVGALHWGIMMMTHTPDKLQRDFTYIWSVIPALIAWIAILLPVQLGANLLLSGFLVHYWQDTRLNKLKILPDWYLGLRLRLTAVASICLFVTAIS